MSFRVYFDESLVDRLAPKDGDDSGRREAIGQRLLVGAVVTAEADALEDALAQRAKEVLADPLSWQHRPEPPGGKSRRDRFAKEAFHFAYDDQAIRGIGLSVMLEHEFRAHIAYTHLQLPNLPRYDLQSAMYYTLIRSLLQRYAGARLEFVFENESNMDSVYGKLVEHAAKGLDRATGRKSPQPRASVEARIARKPNGGLSTVDYCLGVANRRLQELYGDGALPDIQAHENQTIARLDQHLAHLVDFDRAIHHQQFDMLRSPSWVRHISGANSHSGVAKPFATSIDRGPTELFTYVKDEVGLAAALHITREALAEARQLAATPSAYRFKSAKIKGKWRHFTIPTARRLVAVQRRLLNTLSPLNETLHPSCTAYVPGRGPLDAAAPHVGRLWVQKLDIREFFTATSALRVRETFISMGATADVAAAVADLTTYSGSLPTGVRTSPLISNLVLATFDREITDIANSERIDYTRYADDLIFSSDAPFDMAPVVRLTLEPLGYQLNEHKTVTRRRGQPLRIAGLTVFESDAPRLPKRTKRRLRLQLFLLQKALLDARVNELDDEEESRLEELAAKTRGLVRYCNGIEQKTTQRLVAQHPLAQLEVDQRVDPSQRAANVARLVQAIKDTPAPLLTEASQILSPLPPPLGISGPLNNAGSFTQGPLMPDGRVRN